MTGLQDIKSALRRAAVDGIAPGDVRASSDAEKTLADLSDMIAATVLPRQIILRPKTGPTLTLSGDSARLHHIQSSDGTVNLDVKDAEEAAKLLRDAIEQGGHVVLRIHAVDSHGATRSRGIAASQLRTALGVSEPAEDTDPLAQLEAGLPSGTRTALEITDGGFDLLRGDASEAAELAEWAAPMLDTLLAETSPLASAMETQGQLALGWPGDNGRHIRIAGRLGHIVVASVDGAMTAV
ncbi:hypothetical protein V8J82_01380 [Gymnodinialimonas sp. 2305UL16-5]|uniref:hypothetical protein n=1 Tax=Gymnodinialimonas mytili TaxID=3126503 RepID=UPI0030A978AF